MVTFSIAMPFTFFGIELASILLKAKGKVIYYER